MKTSKDVLILRILAGLSLALGIAFGIWHKGSLEGVIIGLIFSSTLYLSSELRKGFDCISSELREGFECISSELREGFDRIVNELRRS